MPTPRETILAALHAELGAYTNYDNYVGVGTWAKIGLNNTDYNDHGAFDAGTNLLTAPMDGSFLFGTTLLYKVNSSTAAHGPGPMWEHGPPPHSA